ncbi:MAG: hypothetical protein AMS17_02175 [Spirochaetes bacterium DG_61]|nr:MAG: hypothetical protein AMS17_02175 [Spirochaetes bacterium DG_61]
MGQRALTVAIINHGCKLNQFEGESLESELENAGFAVVDFRKGVQPDIAVINTCTVTEKSDRKSRASVYRALAAKKPGGIVIVTGCYAETDAQQLRGIRGVDFVLGNSTKAAIPVLIDSLIKGFPTAPLEIDLFFPEKDFTFQFSGAASPHRSRVFVKVQDGCSMACAYCKVPMARGKSRSRPAAEILSYVQQVVAQGYREIVLTGINLGDYRSSSTSRKPERGLSVLLDKLQEIDESFRIRLSSVEPFFFTDDLIEVIAQPRIAPHFHIPLQSGSDRILALMGRPYGMDTYMNLVKKIVALRPESHLATDLIAGFPSENREDFQHTLELVREIGFSSLHVFKYSPRPGTRAFHMPDDVPYEEKALRSRELIALGEELNERYRRQFCGKVREAVFESKGEKGSGRWEGITDNYIRVCIEGDALFGIRTGGNLNRKLLPVRITRVQEHKTWGELTGSDREYQYTSDTPY